MSNEKENYDNFLVGFLTCFAITILFFYQYSKMSDNCFNDASSYGSQRDQWDDGGYGSPH